MIVTSSIIFVSIVGREVLNPPLAACADIPEMTVAIASTAQANAIRRRMVPPWGRGHVQCYQTPVGAGNPHAA